MSPDSKVVRVQGWIIAACDDIAVRERLTRPEVFRMLIRRGIEDYQTDLERKRRA